jgi:hypothetical protein
MPNQDPFIGVIFMLSKEQLSLTSPIIFMSSTNVSLKEIWNAILKLVKTRSIIFENNLYSISANIVEITCERGKQV